MGLILLNMSLLKLPFFPSSSSPHFSATPCQNEINTDLSTSLFTTSAQAVVMPLELFVLLIGVLAEGRLADSVDSYTSSKSPKEKLR